MTAHSRNCVSVQNVYHTSANNRKNTSAYNLEHEPTLENRTESFEARCLRRLLFIRHIGQRVNIGKN